MARRRQMNPPIPVPDPLGIVDGLTGARGRAYEKVSKMPRKSIYTETDASSSRKAAKKKKGPDMTGPGTVAGVAGLRRAVRSGMLDRLRNSDIREMRVRETDAYRRDKLSRWGRSLSKEIAINRQVAKTGIGQSTGVGAELKRADYKRVRSWVTNSFPQGEPSGKRPIRFSTPGSLKEANAAGKAAVKKGVKRTTPPGGRRSGGGTGRGGTRSGGGLKGGGGAFLPQQRGFGEQ